MSRSKILILTLTLWFSLTMCPQVVCGQNGKEEAGVTIELTKLDVNDTTLDLSYKIKNISDHDVWVCDNVGFEKRYEVYIAQDDQTLMIRRRFEVPTYLLYYEPPEGQYFRLRPDEERAESLSLVVPVQRDFVFSGGFGTSKYARRLVLEIGFYNEDLPGLIRGILEEAEKLGGTTLNLDNRNTSIIERYFKGMLITRYFGGLSGFEEYYQDSDKQLRIPYMHQALESEQVLRLEVDGVYIPYGSAPNAEEPANDEVEDTPITLALTKLDVNDTNLELSWKIRNNTDHDVWLCASLSPEYPSVYEYFLDKDAETLVLRRRSDTPIKIEWAMHYPPLRARYIRLCSGQEKAESVSLTVPVRPYRISEGISGNAEYAERLALEIGFYNEDLPGLILHIVEIAEKLNYDFNVGFPDFNDLEIIDRFFGGWSITQSFKHLLGFCESVTSASVDGEFTIHYMGHVLNGEQSLRITVDGVSIPYKGNIPLTGHAVKRAGYEQRQRRSSRNR